MPITILEQNKGAWDVPVVICDHCNRQINNAIEANYWWKIDAETGRSLGEPVKFIHRDCNLAFEQENGGELSWKCIQLACLPRFLRDTLHIDDSQEQNAIALSRPL